MDSGACSKSIKSAAHAITHPEADGVCICMDFEDSLATIAGMVHCVRPPIVANTPIVVRKAGAETSSLNAIAGSSASPSGDEERRIRVDGEYSTWVGRKYDVSVERDPPGSDCCGTRRTFPTSGCSCSCNRHRCMGKRIVGPNLKCFVVVCNIDKPVVIG